MLWGHPLIIGQAGLALFLFEESVMPMAGSRITGQNQSRRRAQRELLVC
jgi:hypothetical protein